MNTIKYIFFFFIISLVSCDSFLDVNPKAEVVNEDMFNTAQGCEDALTGIYSELKQGELYGENLSWHIPDVLAQDLDASEDGPYRGFLRYNYNEPIGLIEALWAKTYEVISHTNNAIINIERKPANTFTLQNIYLGELYGVRALLHFELLRLFAPHVERWGGERGIPYVTRYSFKVTPFSTVYECYGFIINDLIKAQKLLAPDEEYIQYPRTGENKLEFDFLKGRELHLNYYAATALLARVYWMKGELGKAKTEALKVINSEKYPLVEKDAISTLIAGSLSPKESVFGIYSTNFFEKVKGKLSRKTSGALSPFRANTGQVYPKPYQSVYAVDLGENAGIDSRLNWFGLATDDVKENEEMCQKLVDRIRIKDGESTPTKRGLIEGISVLRIPEMYYIVAEALLGEGSAEADHYINQVLLSRGLTKLGERQPSIKLTREVIYNERHKEFFCEGQQWYLMKKLNVDIQSNSELRTIPASNEIYVIPVPDSEFDYRN